MEGKISTTEAVWVATRLWRVGYLAAVATNNRLFEIRMPVYRIAYRLEPGNKTIAYLPLVLGSNRSSYTKIRTNMPLTSTNRTIVQCFVPECTS